MSHKTKDWSALIHDKSIAGDTELLVKGMVETHSTAEKVKLVKPTPQGIVPKQLLLDLVIETSGPGGAVMGWKPVEYREKCEHGTYTSVHIKTDGDPVSIPVHETHA